METGGYEIHNTTNMVEEPVTIRGSGDLAPMQAVLISVFEALVRIGARLDKLAMTKDYSILKPSRCVGTKEVEALGNLAKTVEETASDKLGDGQGEAVS